MRIIASYLVGLWLVSTSLVGYAQEQVTEAAPSETVSVIWVAVFGLLFIGVCVWFMIAMIRSERNAKAAEENAR